RQARRIEAAAAAEPDFAVGGEVPQIKVYCTVHPRRRLLPGLGRQGLLAPRVDQAVAPRRPAQGTDHRRRQYERTRFTTAEIDDEYAPHFSRLPLEPAIGDH